jgi:outer membrane usher protein
MFRWPILLAEAWLLQGLIASMSNALAAPAPPPAAPPPTLTADAPDAMSAIHAIDLYLDVTLNGASRGLIHFGYRDHALWASHTTLHELGIVFPSGGADPMRLDSLKGLHIAYDQQNQAVTLVAPLKSLRLSTKMLVDETPSAAHASAAPGILLNYNLFGTQSQGGIGSLSAYSEFRAFNGFGTFSSTGLSQMTTGTGPATDRTSRLDTSWSTSFPGNLLTLRIGDTLTAATSWSRATRIGGIQFGTNFALQPYLVTTPLAQFLGSATLPSQVELYVNGIKRYSGDVAAGPFQLNSVPGISGAGNAQVVLTNALGQVSNYSFSLYNAEQLLQKGLADWSVELGAVRENYGLQSFDYGGEPVASGTFRYGVNNHLTVETHAECTSGLANAGIGGAVLLGNAGGILSGSLASSDHQGVLGSQFSLGYSWSNARYNIGLNATRATSGYTDVATLYGGPPPALSASATAGLSLGRWGNISASYIALDETQQSSRYVSVNWSKPIGNALSLDFSANQNLRQQSQRSLLLNLNVSLDSDTYASTSVQNENGVNSITLNENRTVPSTGGFGWRAEQEEGAGRPQGLAELDYQGDDAAIQGGVSNLGGKATAYTSVNGALVLIGGHPFATRTLNSAFAVVSTDGKADVPVSLENNPFGKTDSRGLLLISPLNAYQDNHISIDPMNLPANLNVDRVKAITTPTDRAGTIVKFAIVPIRAAAIILVDAAGKAVPLGSQVQLQGVPRDPAEPVLVGFDGAAYLDDLTLHNVLDVQTPSGPCHVSFDYHQQGTDIPQIGPLICKQGQMP